MDVTCNMSTAELERYYYQRGETQAAKSFAAMHDLEGAKTLLRDVLAYGLTVELAATIAEVVGTYQE